MKNAMVMPIVLVITLLISILIGTYIMSSSINISREFNLDLAEVRGYWGAYGAKELNSSTIYKYSSYDINVTKNNNNYSWSLIKIQSGITNNDLYHRIITVVDADTNESNITQYSL